jgi:hypothetical protein
MEKGGAVRGAEPASAAEKGRRRPGAREAVGLAVGAAGSKGAWERVGADKLHGVGSRRTSRRTDRPRRPAVLPSIAMPPRTPHRRWGRHTRHRQEPNPQRIRAPQLELTTDPFV